MSWTTVVVALYLGTLGVLALNGIHRSWLLLTWARSRARAVPPDPEEWPAVTVQLPIFNERYVVERLLDAVGKLRYPRDKLQIQVLDDSTDDTTEIAEAAVERLCALGHCAEFVHREHRVGFKAGALEGGLQTATGSLIAIFDADFHPPEDFLVRTIPWFSGPDVAMVQARWGHLNRRDSWLTRVQAMFLDGHFQIEHQARHRAGRWFNFNGTAGIWRREWIVRAGGWQHDTLTEDMDLSYRAQLAGARFVFLDDVVAPAELPPTMAAFKTQQHRWAKGSIQTAVKLLGRIIHAPAPAETRLEAAHHLLANLSHPMVLMLALLLPWAIQGLPRGTLGWLIELGLFGACVLPWCIYYGVTSKIRDLWALPLALATGLGLSVSQSRAVFEALFSGVGTFVRTPKGTVGATYRSRVHLTVLVEVLLAIYLWSAAAYHAQTRLSSVPFIVLFAVGYTLVAGGSLRAKIHPRAVTTSSSRLGTQVMAQSQLGSVQESVEAS